jgi:hypothetical protein
MAEQLTKMVLRRVELGKTVGAGIDALLDEAAAGYGAYLAPAVADGEPSVDVRQQLVLLRRKTDSHVEALKGIDEGVLTRTSDKDFLKTELVDLTRRVTVKLRRVADVARGVYGPESLEAIGLTGETTRVPLRVYDRGRRAQTLLRGRDLKLRPKAGFILAADGEPSLFSPSALAEELEPELTELGLLVDARFEENREQTIARLRRQRLVEEFDLGMRGIVRMVQGMLLAAGLIDLAKQFRLRLRRLTRQQPGESQEAESPQDSPLDPSTGTAPSDSADPSTSTP